MVVSYVLTIHTYDGWYVDRKNILLLYLNVQINHMYVISTKPPSSHQMPYLLMRLFFWHMQFG